jgi:glycosyltransferase involved in cell wall biosynthesis
MKIGIDGSRAFIKNRTGIEEYSYRVIKNLIGNLRLHQVVLYIRKNQTVDFELPENWKIKVINCPRLWTQVGLSLEMLLHPVDTLLILAHTVPIIHPEKTVVVIHGLEYEFCPQAYSWFERFYMRLTIKKSCAWASEIVAVSENTKKDLMNLYNVAGEKIKVIYEGYEKTESFASGLSSGEKLKVESKIAKPYLLFVGRIEERKNIGNIIDAFGILKEKYDIPHKLVLAGKPGHGYDDIKSQISKFQFKEEILELGFISDQEKFELMKKADVFVFPTLYEGFGIPVLEAQSVGCPVVASNNSSIPEVAHGSALLVDSQNPENIAENIYSIISNETQKNAIIVKGLENVKRFSWEVSSKEISEILVKSK